MDTNIGHWLIEKGKELLLHLGVNKDYVEDSEIIIIFVIMFAVAFIIMEIIYRIVHFLSKKIVRHREYLFLSQMLNGKRLRAITYIIPPIIIDVLIQFLFEEKPKLLYYTERIVWIYFIISRH